MNDHSNVIVHNHDEDLNEWLKAHDVRIHVRETKSGWNSSLEGALHVETHGPCNSSGRTPLEAVQQLVSWMTGCRFNRTGPLGFVPSFSQDSISRAVTMAQYTDPARRG
jgi:hypothetical protein